MTTHAARRSSGRAWVLLGLRVGVATALVIDAVVHLQDAHYFDLPKGSLLSKGDLFRVQAAVAIAVAVLVLVWPRVWSWAVALLVTASVFATVLLYTYVDVGRLPGLPDMYDPLWLTPGKLLSAYAEGIGMVLAGVGLVLTWPTRGRGDY